MNLLLSTHLLPDLFTVQFLPQRWTLLITVVGVGERLSCTAWLSDVGRTDSVLRVIMCMPSGEQESRYYWYITP